MRCGRLDNKSLLESSCLSSRLDHKSLLESSRLSSRLDNKSLLESSCLSSRVDSNSLLEPQYSLTRGLMPQKGLVRALAEASYLSRAYY